MTYKYLFQQDELAHLVNLEQQLDLTEKKMHEIESHTMQYIATQCKAIHCNTHHFIL